MTPAQLDQRLRRLRRHTLDLYTHLGLTIDNEKFMSATTLKDNLTSLQNKTTDISLDMNDLFDTAKTVFPGAPTTQPADASNEEKT